MTFKNEQQRDVVANKHNFKQLLRGDVLGTRFVQVEFLGGSIEWLRATDDEILKAAMED